jgi:hypothetical protein
LNGVGVIWSLNELDPPTQLKSNFPLEKGYALTSLPLHLIKVSNGSASQMATIYLGTILAS